MIRDWIDRCSIAIATDYTGLGVAEMTRLRRALRESGVEYRVIKNSLALLAADGSNKPEVKEIVEGPTALAFGYDDPLTPAKALVGFVNANRSELKVRGGVMGERVLTAEEIATLAAIPSKEELLARLMGQLNGPITGLVYVLSAPIAGLARVLQRHIESAPAAEQSGAEEPAAEQDPDEEPPAEEPAEDASAEGAEESDPEEPAVEQDSDEEPSAEEPAAEEPTPEEPVDDTAPAETEATEAEEPVAEEPEETSSEEAEVSESDEPVAEQESDKEPTAEEPAAGEASEQEGEPPETAS